MPAIYAHEKFGIMVYQQLPKREQQIISRYPMAFRIGLQGPDFLFFYQLFRRNKVNRLGKSCHRESIVDFLKRNRKVIEQCGRKGSRYSYLLGYLCHYALDTTCHPYVAKAMETTGCSHSDIEGALDQWLLKRDGFKPEKYPLFELVPKDYRTAQTVSAFFPELSTGKVEGSLKWLYRVKRLSYAPGIVKRKLLYGILKLTGFYNNYKGHIMEPRLNPLCKKSCKILYREMKAAVPVALQLMKDAEELSRGIVGNHDFERDFYGRE